MTALPGSGHPGADDSGGQPARSTFAFNPLPDEKGTSPALPFSAAFSFVVEATVGTLSVPIEPRGARAVVKAQRSKYHQWT